MLQAHLLDALLKEVWLLLAHQKTPDSMVVHPSMHQIFCLVHCQGHLQLPLCTMLCQSYSRSLRNDLSLKFQLSFSPLRTEGNKGTFKALDWCAVFGAL